MKTDCIRWAWRHPVQLGASVALGMAILTGIGWWQSLTSPVYPVMLGAPSITRGPAGTLWLTTDFQSASPNRCLRLSSMTLTAEAAPGVWAYYNFGGNIGGRGLGGSRYRYRIVEGLPPDFPPGDYELFVRLHYQCEPFGLVHWEHTLPARKVTIP